MRVTHLTEREWRAREQDHYARIRPWTAPHRRRRSQAQKHPIFDFLFTYYSLRLARLERWQPGPGPLLTGPGAKKFLRRTGYRYTTTGVELDPTTLTESLHKAVASTCRLLEATAARQAQLSCFGLHEWAMSYRQAPEQRRHAQLPLRLGATATDEVVDAQEIRCTHYDAFRFFTDDARPHNQRQLTRGTQTDVEQPGCLHANMDLFKWAYKLGAFVPSELLADCFELAAEIRIVDMRASPYDLTELGYLPIAVETREGRAEYARAQAAFAQRAAPLRARLITHCRELLALSA